MFCTNCGTKINDGDSFCTNCGTKVLGKRESDNGNKLSFSDQVKKAKTILEHSNETLVDEIDTVQFGSYPQSDTSGSKKEPIDWLVLEKQDDKVLLLSKYIIDCKPFNEEYEEVTWETCTLRNWLNNVFYNNAFNSDEQKNILITEIENKDNTENDNNVEEYSSNDKIFCLSEEEVIKYFNQPSINIHNKIIATQGTNYAKSINAGSLTVGGNGWHEGNSIFWLRTPGISLEKAMDILGDGSFYKSDNVAHYDIGVRPAMWVKI